MEDAGLKIVVQWDASGVAQGASQTAAALDATNDAVTKAAIQVQMYSDTVTKAAHDEVLSLAEVNKYWDEIAKKTQLAIPPTANFSKQVSTITPAIKEADSAGRGLLDTTAKQRIAFVDLGRIVTGQGFSLRSLASNFTLFSPAVVVAAAAIGGLAYVLLRQTDAEKKAAEEAKKLHETLLSLKDVGDVTAKATGSEEGNLERVRDLAVAVLDVNKSYKERQRALDELKQTNKSYFGDLTLEAASLAILSQRVADYSNALITEAVIKGQVSEIAKVSEEYEKQKDVLDKLRTGLDRVRQAQEAAKKNIDPENFGGSGIDTKLQDVQNQVAAANGAFQKQRDIVEQLGTAIATYKGKLQQAIEEQIKQRSLTELKTAKVKEPFVDPLNSIKDIEKQIEDFNAKSLTLNVTPREKDLKEAFQRYSDLFIEVRKLEKDQNAQADKELEKGQITLQKALDNKKRIEIESNKERLLAQFAYDNNVKAVNAKHDAEDLAAAQKKADKDFKLAETAFTKNFKILEDFAKIQDKFRKEGLVVPQLQPGTDPKKKLQDATEDLKIFNEELDKVKKEASIVQPAFDALFQSITDGSTSALQAVGQALEQIIIKLAEAAAEAAIFAAILNLVAPGSSAAAGGFGNAFKNLFGSFSGLPKFAAGGTAEGPSSGYLAILHGKEHVIPDSKVQNYTMGGGSSSVFIPNAIIRGEDIVIIYNKVTKRKSRV